MPCADQTPKVQGASHQSSPCAFLRLPLALATKSACFAYSRPKLPNFWPGVYRSSCRGSMKSSGTCSVLAAHSRTALTWEVLGCHNPECPCSSSFFTVVPGCHIQHCCSVQMLPNDAAGCKSEPTTGPKGCFVTNLNSSLLRLFRSSTSPSSSSPPCRRRIYFRLLPCQRRTQNTH